MAVFENIDHGFAITGLTTDSLLIEVTLASYSGPSASNRYIYDGRYPSGDSSSFIYIAGGSTSLNTSSVSSVELNGTPITNLATSDITGGEVLSWVASTHNGDLVLFNRFNLAEPVNVECNQVTIKTSDGLTTLHTYDLSNPTQATITDGTGTVDGELLNFTFASGPTLSSVPATAYSGQSRTVTGTGFGATQGTGGLTIGGVAQTITSWSDTSITFTTVQGNNKYEAGKTLEVTTDAAETVSDTIELVADTANGFGYVDMSSPNTTDESSVAFGATPTVVTGDQFEWEDFNNLGNLTVDAEGFVTNVDTEGTFRGRFWDATDSTWGTVETFTASLPSTVVIKISIKSSPKSSIKDSIKGI